MSLFVLDTAGDNGLLKNNKTKAEDPYLPFSGRGPLLINSVDDKFPDAIIDDDDDYGGLPPPSKDISDILSQYDTVVKAKPKTKAQRELELGLEMVKAAEEERRKNKLQQSQPGERTKKAKLIFPELDIQTGKCSDKLSETDVQKEMANSILPGIELKKGVPQLRDKKLRDLRRIERSKTKGEGWFNMPATEVTEEVENDLKILQMRSVLNPKHFYKKNDLKVLPKYFQIGTVQHSPLDYYKERDVRKNKKKTMVDELLADAEVQKYTKRKFQEVTARNNKYAHKKAMKKMKKLKKNK